MQPTNQQFLNATKSVVLTRFTHSPSIFKNIFNFQHISRSSPKSHTAATTVEPHQPNHSISTVHYISTSPKESHFYAQVIHILRTMSLASSLSNPFSRRCYYFSMPSLSSSDKRHVSLSLPRSSDSLSVSPPCTHRAMDAALFDCFDVCAMSDIAETSLHSFTPPSPPSKLSTALHAVSARFQSWLPRRLHEPTGPWALMLDMLLSLFVAQGACRSAIDALPLEVVGGCNTDLESEGVAVPVTEGDKCAICLGCYEEGDAVRHLSCNHAFHAECVDVWLERKSLCPICKSHSC